MLTNAYKKEEAAALCGYACIAPLQACTYAHSHSLPVVVVHK